MVTTAEYSHIDRSELARTVNGWEMDGMLYISMSNLASHYDVQVIFGVRLPK